MRTDSLDQLLPPEHQVRLVWADVEQLDLSPLLSANQAVAGRPGQPANDPHRLRAPTAEWANAGLRQRGLYQVRVRGLQKVLAVSLWHALRQAKTPPPPA